MISFYSPEYSAEELFLTGWTSANELWPSARLYKHFMMGPLLLMFWTLLLETPRGQVGH